jgi:hypothetical protein
VRAVLIMAVLFAAILLVFLPISYLWSESQLPPLESEFDLERGVRAYVEGERMAIVSGMDARDRPNVKFEKPDLTHFPKDLVAFYIVGWDCPTYFQTPREQGLKWGWRLLQSQMIGSEPGGDGRCERIFAANVSRSMKVPRGTTAAIAGHKIHGLLQKDQLVAYDLGTIFFEPAVLGVDDAAARLFHRTLDSLKLEELAELALALPPYYYYDDLRICRNASQLRQGRDVLIDNLFKAGLIPEDRARAARSQPLTCVGTR